MSHKFTIRSEVDFIAMAPVVLGFPPERSLVMLTIDSFHARVDLPEEEDVQACVDALLGPAKKHNVAGVAFIIYDEEEHDTLKAELLAGCIAESIPVVAALEVGDGKWRRFTSDEWEPLDLSDHPLTLEAQFHDKAPRYMSREALIDHVRPVGADMSPEAIAALEGLRTKSLDDILEEFSRESAREAHQLWVEVFRGLEPGSEEVPTVAVAVAFSAWLSGDGAACWVALDHADTSSSWKELLTLALQQALDPQTWEASKADG